MRVSTLIEHKRLAARQLSPADQDTAITIANRLGFMGVALKDAQSALTKWRSGEKYAPQKDNLKAALKQIMTGAKATLAIADRLP